MKLAFSPGYLRLTIILLAIEIAIALFVRDTVIRPFVGDVLVVVLIYGFLRIFLRRTGWRLALAVFLFACGIEVLQYFDYVAALGLEKNRALAVIMGRTFEWIDFIAYFAGFTIILPIDKLMQKEEPPAE